MASQFKWDPTINMKQYVASRCGWPESESDDDHPGSQNLVVEKKPEVNGKIILESGGSKDGNKGLKKQKKHELETPPKKDASETANATTQETPPKLRRMNAFLKE